MHKTRAATMKLPSYNGGKTGSGTYQTIINRIPPHSVYIEPFLSHGGIFRKKRLAKISILNDIDPGIFERWKQMKIPGADIVQGLTQGALFETINRPQILLFNADYKKIIERFANHPGAFIYCDPPYPMDARKSQRQLYFYEWQNTDEHIEFLDLIRNVKIPVMISTNENPLYPEALKGWNVHKFQSMTRGGLQTEYIYFNYPAPEILHDIQFIGDNYRDRFELKRKIQRFETKLQKMKPLERIAILSSIINQHKDTTEKLIKL